MYGHICIKPHVTVISPETIKVIHGCIYSYIHCYYSYYYHLFAYNHSYIIHISFIYATIPLNVLYSSSNSSSFWTNFEQSLNKFVSILVVIYIICKQQYKRIYIIEKKIICNNNVIQVNDIVNKIVK